MAASPSSETAVRQYLNFLAGLTSVVDEAELERRQKEVDEATDPVERLRAYAALERARATDENVFKLDFIHKRQGVG
jgi:hypothetical protein